MDKSRECDSHASDSEDDSSSYPIRTSTMETILGIKIDKGRYFKHKIAKEGSFTVNSSDFMTLYTRRNRRRLPKYEWEEVFIDGLKKVNPYCSFAFKKHWVSECEPSKRKQAGVIFTAIARCTFTTCPVEVKLVIRDVPNVIVSFKETDIIHVKGERRARKITGSKRQRLLETFSSGMKPKKQFDTAICNKEPAVLLSGNMDEYWQIQCVVSKNCKSKQTNRQT